MSRIGKRPVEIPSGVEVALSGRDIEVKGSKGTLNWSIPHDIDVKQEDGAISFTPRKEDRPTRALWGLARAMTANMVQGVSEGFERRLEIRGVGYRAAVQGQNLNLSLGFSHPVNMPIPEGITATVNENTEIVLTGYDKQKLGQFAANIRKLRPVEPYKGKGVRYVGEHVVMKEGKKK